MDQSTRVIDLSETGTNLVIETMTSTQPDLADAPEGLLGLIQRLQTFGGGEFECSYPDMLLLAPMHDAASKFWAQVPDPIDPEQAKNLETLRFALAANAQAIDQARSSCERAMVIQAVGEVVEEGRFATDVDSETARPPQRRSLLRVRATTLGILQNIYTSLRERAELPLQELARIEYLLTGAVEVPGVGSDVFYDVQVDGATAGLVHFILGDFLATDPVSQVPRKERRELRHWLRGMEADRTELWGVYFNSLDGPGSRSGARGFFRRR